MKIISYSMKDKKGLFLEHFRNKNVHLGHHFYCSIPCPAMKEGDETNDS